MTEPVDMARLMRATDDNRPQGFYDELVIDHTIKSNNGFLKYDFTYVDKLGRKHVAKAGMPTDGLTIRKVPRLLWWMTGSPYGKYLAAAVIHDWYCIEAKKLVGDEAIKLRRFGDDLFYEMLQYLGASRWTRRLMFTGVRFGAVTGRG